MFDPQDRRFDRDKRNRPRPPERPEEAKANPSKERPRPPDGPEEAKAVPPFDELYKPTKEDIQRELRRLQPQRRDIAKLKGGDSTFRIVPPREGWRFHEVIHYHWGVGPRRRGTRCRDDFDEACFLCEKVDELSKSPDPDDQAEAKDMQQTIRCLLHVIMLDEVDKGVQVISLPISVVATLVSYLGDPELQDFLDPERGRNVKIRKIGEGKGTRYSAPILSPRTSPIPYKDWRRELKDLREMFGRPSYEAQRRLYEGIEGGEEVN